LQYAQEVGLLLVYDGNSEGFGSNQSQEVLYENTGLSRYFPVHFGRDIMKCETVEDFEAFSWEGEDAERGRQRIRRVYQQLALAPGLYWSSENRGDYDYIKNQRQSIGRNLGEALGGELHVHKNGAFFVLEDGDRCGLAYPGSRAMSDVALLLCGQLREQIVQGTYRREENDTVVISRREFQREVADCRSRYGNGWGSALRGISLERLCQELTEYMSGWMLLEDCGEELLLCPAVGKWVGRYPAAWRNECGEEDENEPVEDE
jgi:uncharacterized protein (TIGR02678 family)